MKTSKAPTSAFKFIIFDCDGVLVDTETISNSILANQLTELGYKCNTDQAKEIFMGRSMKDCFRIVKEDLKLNPPEDFLDQYDVQLFEALKTSVKPIPGVLEALKNIQLPKCVASSGSFEKMNLTLGQTGIVDFFSGNIFSTTQVKNGKPAPDLFLLAAHTNKMDSKYIVVIEDSAFGIKAAKAAGMTAFGFARETDESKLIDAGADLIFKDMKHLPELIRSYNGFLNK